MSNFEGLYNGRLGITLPVGTNGLSLNASLARTRYELGGAFENLQASSLSNVAAYASAPSGDKGVIANLHLRYALNPYLTASAFYDVGRVQLRHRPFTTEANSQTRQGIGVGLNVQVKGLSLEAKTAWKLNRPTTEPRRPTVWLKVGYGF